MSDTISRKGVFIPDITVEMFRNASLESIEDLMASGEMEDLLLPSAQPDIIRCRDCRYYQDNNNGYPHMNCKWDANETPDADDFCSEAERRTDE